MLVSDDAARVTAVFSWKCAQRGDALYDVAWCTFWGDTFHPGIAALDAFEHGGLIDRARAIEAMVLDRLRTAQASDPRIGDVRGRGAMVALELVDPTTGDPDPALTGRVAAAAHAEGVIVLTCGTYGNVIRLLPPLIVSEEEVAEAVRRIERACARIAQAQTGPQRQGAAG